MRNPFSRRSALLALLALPFSAPAKPAPLFTLQAVDVVKGGVNVGEVVFLSSELQPLVLAPGGRRWFVVGEPLRSRTELQASKERLKRWITT